MFEGRRRLTKRRGRLAGAAAVLCASLGATLFVAAAPASAAPMTVSFSLNFWNGDMCASVSANIPTDQYDTYGYLNNGAHAKVEVWGDDPYYDDLITRTGWAYQYVDVDGVSLYGAASGINVLWEMCYPVGVFNEDPEGPDELYGQVVVIDGDGNTLANARSSNVYMWY